MSVLIEHILGHSSFTRAFTVINELWYTLSNPDVRIVRSVGNSVVSTPSDLRNLIVPFEDAAPLGINVSEIQSASFTDQAVFLVVIKVPLALRDGSFSFKAMLIFFNFFGLIAFLTNSLWYFETCFTRFEEPVPTVYLDN